MKRHAEFKAVAAVTTLVLVPPLFWGGLLSFQQVRVRSAIRACERELIPDPDGFESPTLPKERVRVIRSAGCRAVPLLLDAIEETGNENQVLGCHDLLMAVAGQGRRTNHPDGMQLCGAAYGMNQPDQRKGSIADAREWWDKHRAKHHPWWKPWSWSCLGD